MTLNTRVHSADSLAGGPRFHVWSTFAIEASDAVLELPPTQLESCFASACRSNEAPDFQIAIAPLLRPPAEKKKQLVSTQSPHRTVQCSGIRLRTFSALIFTLRQTTEATLPLRAQRTPKRSSASFSQVRSSAFVRDLG